MPTLKEMRAETPEAIARRLALAIFDICRMDGHHYNEPVRHLVNGLNAPSWPAVWAYDNWTDQPLWVEIKVPMHAIDFRRAYPENMNAAAIALADNAEDIWAKQERDQLAMRAAT